MVINLINLTYRLIIYRNYHNYQSPKMDGNHNQNSRHEAYIIHNHLVI